MRFTSKQIGFQKVNKNSILRDDCFELSIQRIYANAVLRRVNKKEIKFCRIVIMSFMSNFAKGNGESRGEFEKVTTDADDCRLNCGRKFENAYSSIDLHNQKEPYSMAKREKNNKMQLFVFSV